MVTTINTTTSSHPDYENSVNKLLLHADKCKAITNVAAGTINFDSTLPICIELHLTNACNLNCDWCIDRKIRGNHHEISLPVLINLLDSIAGKNVGITIEGGGEPTMHKKFESFIRECWKRKIKIGLITNGTNRISEELLKCFDFIRVSLDASTAEEYLIEKGRDRFEEVISNLQYMRHYAPDLVLGVSYVLNKRNSNNLPILFNRVRNLNLNYIRMRNVEENEDLSLSKGDMEEIKSLLDGYMQDGMKVVLSSETDTNLTNNKGLPCIAHSLRALIVASGDVYLCSKRRHDPLVLGNINEDNFLNIWYSSRRMEAAKKLLDCNSQLGCSVCRITKFNELFYHLINVRTSSFI